jgi:type I restriction enzyme S subunit
MMQGDCPKGYKQTEVGVIPEDWNVALVGQAFEICNNLRMPISQSVRETMAGSYPYYGPTSIQGYINEYRIEGEYALIGEDGDHFLKWQVQPMTQLVSGRFNVNNHAHLIKGTKNVTAWFYYYFSRRDLTPYLTRQGAGRFKLKKSTLTGIPCALPPTKAEQESIAEALSDADALIESLEQLIAKKRQVKQGAMQELLTGKRRLPGFNVGATGRSPLRDVPHGWEVKRLGDLCTMKSGEGITAKSIDDVSPFPCFGGNGLRGFTTRFTHEGNHCLIGRVGALCGNLLKVTGRFFASEHAIVVTALENVDINWLTLALGMLELNRRAESSAQPVLTVSKLQPLEILVPTAKTEQTAIAAILSDMDAEIAELEAKLAKARQVKQGMMQELLTGRIRLV